MLVWLVGQRERLFGECDFHLIVTTHRRSIRSINTNAPLRCHIICSLAYRQWETYFAIGVSPPFKLSNCNEYVCQRTVVVFHYKRNLNLLVIYYLKCFLFWSNDITLCFVCTCGLQLVLSSGEQIVHSESYSCCIREFVSPLCTFVF